ncbi:ClpV1 family T6SS ATPase [Endozoicomonas sp. (ex Bugula neritina AB1)]|nr:ClpV1 family T6SS ATPase [Endozoicomonas sp. (ex Bugula neritina AB1)]
MQQLELKTLVSRLSAELRHSLETAAALCVNKGHQAVEVEHWLYQLCKESGEAMTQVLTTQQLSAVILLENLEQRLAQLKGGYDGTPSLSVSTVSLVQDAWLVCSVNFQQNVISVYHLILVLLEKDNFNLVETPLTLELGKISKETLKQLAAGKPSEESTSGKPETTGSALDKYTVNMVADVETGAGVVGRDLEIRQLVDILCRRRQNNPILVGDAGVGKTAIVEGLAQQVVRGDVPDNMQGVEIRSLDLGLLQAGASIKGEFESRIKDVINEVKQADHAIIIFIDEAHTLIGAGGAAGQNDAANLLKPALARGEFKTIAATTWAEYKKFFEKDAALNRRFQPVKILEPDEASAIEMTRAIAHSLELHHQLRIHEAAVVAAVQLSTRYLPERQLPDKAISLLDTACSRVALSRHTTPVSLQNLKHQQQSLNSELEGLSRDSVVGANSSELINALKDKLSQVNHQFEVLQTRWKKEKALAEQVVDLEFKADTQYLQGNAPDDDMSLQLANLQQQLSECQGEQPLVFSRVDADSVATVVASWTGIPVGNILSDEIQALMSLEERLQHRVIGQDSALAEISKSIRIGRAGLSDPRKPVGVFLMCGPSGVGKTETGLALADQLYGGEQNLTIINMTEFKEEHKVSALLGAPAGYVGYGEGGVLTEAIRRCPYSVLLLDEMEKAHPGVHDIFYQIFDKGYVTDSEGREVDFRQTIIIMTSNAADSAICELVDSYQNQKKGIPNRDVILKTINDDLLKFFKPAFLGRVTLIPYLPLGDDQMAKICRLTLQRMAKNISLRYGADLSVDDEVVKQLVQWSDSPQTGARAIEQQINRSLLPQLAIECLARMGSSEAIRSIHIALDEHRLVYRINQ